MTKFKVVKVFKKSHRRTTVEKNLSEPQAQRRVQQDMRENPECNVYMMIYTRQQ